MRARRAPVLLCAWTLFVWGLRSRNLTDDSVEVGAGQVLPIVGFVGVGLIVVVILLRARSRLFVPIERIVLMAGAAVTALYWLIRGIEIFFDDHSPAFIAIHTVLATISIGLGVWTIMTIRGIGDARWGLTSAVE